MLTAILTIVLPPVLLLLASRRWPRFRRSGAPVVGCSLWLLSLVPACAVGLDAAGQVVAAAIEAGPHNRAMSVAGAGPIGPLYARQYITQGHLHGLDGWQGVDVKGSAPGTCAYDILSPFDGTVRHNGRDGYNHHDPATGRTYEQATMLTLTSADGRFSLTLLHGHYDPALRPGSAVRRGQVIGRAGSEGWSTGCHDHVILRDNGRIVNYLDYAGRQTQTTALTAPRQEKPLKISWYDPALGGINCDSDCTTMASGVKVTPDRYGRTAACIRPWLGKTVVIAGLGEFECLDTGGAIVEHSTYIWIDIMATRDTAPQFGQYIYNWSLK